MRVFGWFKEKFIDDVRPLNANVAQKGFNEVAQQVAPKVPVVPVPVIPVKPIESEAQKLLKQKMSAEIKHTKEYSELMIKWYNEYCHSNERLHHSDGTSRNLYYNKQLVPVDITRSQSIGYMDNFFKIVTNCYTDYFKAAKEYTIKFDNTFKIQPIEDMLGDKITDHEGKITDKYSAVYKKLCTLGRGPKKFIAPVIAAAVMMLAGLKFTKHENELA